jgi:hypothetical protein
MDSGPGKEAVCMDLVYLTILLAAFAMTFGLVFLFDSLY